MITKHSSFPYSTPEDVKKFWIKCGSNYKNRISPDIYEEQETILIRQVMQEFDTSKIHTVLDVGCGYGRIAKLLLDNLPSIFHYYMLDISYDQLHNSESYLRNFEKGIFTFNCEDFEKWEIPNSYYGYFDFVVCVETMTVLPYDIQPWINKLESLSKKYIVSLDWYDIDPNKPALINQINTWHDYPKHSKANRNIFWTEQIEIPKYTESTFLCRVR